MNATLELLMSVRIYPNKPLNISFPYSPPTPLKDMLSISAQELWQQLHNGQLHPLIVDVREPREFKQGHIPDAQLRPLSRLMTERADFPTDNSIVLVCRSGRRSIRAAQILKDKGFEKHTRFGRGHAGLGTVRFVGGG